MRGRGKHYLVIFSLITVILGFGMSTHADAASLQKVWQITGYFATPESVAYDATRNVLYVSNQNTVGTKKMNGYISMVSMDGKILKDRWAIGMDQPYGLDVVGDKLYVGDITGLLEIDIPTATVVKRWDALENSALNGVVVDSNGDVYVTDFWRHAIWKLSATEKDADGKRIFSEWLVDETLAAPNGLCIDGDSLVVAPWGFPIKDDYTTDEGAKLLKVSLSDKSITAASGPVGNLDGIQNDGNGNFIVSDWVGNNIFQISSNGDITLLGNLARGNGWAGFLAGEADAYAPGLADIEYIPSQKKVIIPLMMDNGLACYEIK
jgi:sugar lactone lactonase YvrE